MDLCSGKDFLSFLLNYTGFYYIICHKYRLYYNIVGIEDMVYCLYYLRIGYRDVKVAGANQTWT